MSRQHRSKRRGQLQGNPNNAARREVHRQYDDYMLAYMIATHQRFRFLGEHLGQLRAWLDHIGKPDFVNYTPERAIEAMKFIIDAAFDYERCLCSCKNIYFCTLPEGHEGPHSDDGFHWGPEGDDGFAEEIKTLVPEGL